MSTANSFSTRLRGFLVKPWRELALFALMVMETCWIIALYVAVLEAGRPDGLLRALLVFGPIYFGVHILVRAMNHYGLRTTIRRVVLAVLLATSLQGALIALVPQGTNPSILAFLLNPFRQANDNVIIPVHFWIMLVVALLWLRSISLARYPVGSDLAVNSFKFGMVMWFFYGIIVLVVDQPNAPWVLFLFLFAGFISMSTSRLSEITGMRGGRQVRFHRAWLVGIAGSTLLILGTGFLVASLLQGQLASVAQAIIMVLAGLVLLVLMILVAPFVILFLLILPKLTDLFSGVSGLAKIRNIAEQLQQVFQPLFENEKLQALFRNIWAARAAVLMVVILILAVIVLLSARWLQQRAHSANEDDPESILSAQDIFQMLRNSIRQRLQSLADRLRGRSGIPDARRFLAAMRIRWIYYQMVDLASRLDHPRPEAATPLEFQPTLQDLFPAQAAGVGVITAAYLQVRYGEIPEGDEDIQAVTDAWQQIQEAGQPQLALKRQELKNKNKYSL